jgi:hypothetical protein
VSICSILNYFSNVGEPRQLDMVSHSSPKNVKKKPIGIFKIRLVLRKLDIILALIQQSCGKKLLRQKI